MASYSPLEPSELEELAARWGLSVESSRLMGGGLNNTSYLLATEAGQMVLTVVDFPASLPAALHAEVLSHLRMAGIPVTEPMCLVDGSGYVALRKGKSVMLKRYISGRPPSLLDAAQLRYLGELLARVGTVAAPSGVRSAKRRLPNRLEEVTSGWQARDFADWVLKNARRMDTMTGIGLPTGLIHGDPFADNMVVSDDGQMFVIDWETATIDILILDLGFAVLGNCRVGNVIDAGRVATLLDGYGEHRRLSSAELDHLPDAVSYAATVIGFWRYQHLNHLHQEAGKVELYKEMVTFVASVEDWSL